MANPATIVLDTAKPPGQQEDDDTLIWAQGEMTRAKTHSADWRTEVKQCYDFCAGRQWEDSDVAYMESNSIAPVTFNRTKRTVNAVVGLEISNRHEVRYLPRTLDDSGVNELLTDASKWARDLCDAEDNESEAFEDMIVSGMGWTETSMEYADDPDGRVNIDRVDPLEMFWDPSSTKKNLADRRWTARAKKYTLMEMKEIWPDFDGTANGETWLDDDPSPHDATPPQYTGKVSGNAGLRKAHEVVQFQWWEMEDYYRVLTADGKAVAVDADKWAARGKLMQEQGLVEKAVKMRRRVYWVMFFSAGQVLEKRKLPTQTGFTFECMTAMRDRNRNVWFGLVSIMLDPQRWANKWLSQMLHILNTNAKGGVLFETGAVANARKAKQDWAKANAWVEINPGKLDAVRERLQAQFPTGFDRLVQYAIEAINDTPGVNAEIMGLVAREQAGVLESMRKQAAVVMLSAIFDAMRQYRKRQGRLLAVFIREFISDGRLIRIAGPAGAKYVPLLKSQTSFDYDVIVDETPSSHNVKERLVAVMQTLLPVMKESGLPPLPLDLIDYMPIPVSLAEKWKAMGVKPPQVQQAEQQFMEAMKQAELHKLTARNDLDRARAMKTLADAKRTDPVYELQQQQAELQAKTQLQMAEFQAEMQLKQAQLQADIEAQMAKLQSDHALALEGERTKLQIAEISARAQVEAADIKAQSDAQQKAADQAMVTQQAEAGKQPPIVINNIIPKHGDKVVRITRNAAGLEGRVTEMEQP